MYRNMGNHSVLKYVLPRKEFSVLHFVLHEIQSLALFVGRYLTICFRKNGNMFRGIGFQNSDTEYRCGFSLLGHLPDIPSNLCHEGQIVFKQLSTSVAFNENNIELLINFLNDNSRIHELPCCACR